MSRSRELWNRAWRAWRAAGRKYADGDPIDPHQVLAHGLNLTEFAHQQAAMVDTSLRRRKANYLRGEAIERLNAVATIRTSIQKGRRPGGQQVINHLRRLVMRDVAIYRIQAARSGWRLP